MLAKCPECGKEISTSAKACPNCGCRDVPQPPPKPPTVADRVVTFVLGIVIAALGAGIIYGVFASALKDKAW